MSLKDFYDNLAPTYEQAVADKRIDSHLTQQVKKVFELHQITSGSILDIGCGPGNLKNDLRGAFEFTGVDISPKMLHLAEQKGYKTILGNMEEVLQTIPDQSYDYVVAIGCLLFIENAQIAIERIDRIARRGWAISLDDITERYAHSFEERAHAKAFNHSKVHVGGATEDFPFASWKSKDEQMVSRLVFKKIQT